MSDTLFDEQAALTAYEAEENFMRQELKRHEAATAEWLGKWKNHCTACGGWGGNSHTEMHGFRHGNGETIFDECDALPRAETCHRCGEDGLTQDSEGPCKVCGWNYDDGRPRF